MDCVNWVVVVWVVCQYSYTIGIQLNQIEFEFEFYNYWLLYYINHVMIFYYTLSKYIHIGIIQLVIDNNNHKFRIDNNNNEYNHGIKCFMKKLLTSYKWSSNY